MATRSKRFISGLITGYGSIGANIVFTLTSIPLALHYLDKEQFGLWALAVQINGYLNLIDLGMSGAVSRFVADHKDDVDGGDYGSHLLTGGVVFAIQGLIIALAGIIFSWFAPSMFSIPPHLAGSFSSLLMLLSVTTGASVLLRTLGAPLWAFQRFDVINGYSSIGLLLSLGLLWLGFELHWGVMSFAIAQVPVLLGSIAIYTWICRRNHYYPSFGHWGKPSMETFKNIFHYGKNALMVTVGSQLINATQIMIISRCVGLDAAATFAVATKFYTMAMQLVLIPISASAPGLAELYVRREHTQFVRRYWDLITITIVIATLAGVGLSAGNITIVRLWTGGAIHWSWIGDLCLGLLIVLRNINGCLVGMFGLTKNWKPVRLIYLLEGLLFVPLAIVLAKWNGLNGVLVASLISHALITSTLAAKPAIKILGTWHSPVRSILLPFALLFFAASTTPIADLVGLSDYWRLAVMTLLCLFAAALTWKLIMPQHLRSESSKRISGIIPDFLKSNSY